MKVKLNTGMAGDTFSYAPGEIVDLPDATAKTLIERAQAEPVTATKKTETATRSAPENAAKRSSRK